MKTPDTDSSRSGTPVAYFQGGIRRFFLSDYDAFAVRVGANGPTTFSPTVSANDNQWHHIAVTWRNTTSGTEQNVKLYKEGVQAGQMRLSPGFTFTDGGYFIVGAKERCAQGGAVCALADSFKGQLYDVRVWASVRSQTEIQANMHTLSGNTAALKGRWLFNEANIVDHSPSGLNSMLLYNEAALSRFRDVFTQRLLDVESGQVTISEATVLSTRYYSSAENPIEPDGGFKRNDAHMYVFNGHPPFTGDHLASLPIAGAQDRAFTWRKAPAGPFDGKGRFDNTHQNDRFGRFTLVGDDLFIMHPGEGWRHAQKLANQLFHYRASDGQFLEQFGMPVYDKVAIHAPGTGSNLRVLAAVRVGNAIYLYTNDEGGRGVHRWRITPADLR